VKILVLPCVVATWLLAGVPLFAQTAPAGPVHVPAGYATNTAAPASAPSAVAPTNAAPVVAPPVPSASAADTNEDIRDIRGPLAIPYPLAWLYGVAATLILLALAYAAWRFFRRGPKTRGKLPHEIALERLEAARALMMEDRVREYAFAVSEAVRVYIEQRFGERAARRTTEEFISDLLRQTGTPLARHRPLLEDFLNHCDLPKFARWQLSAQEMESMHESARAFILNTEPSAASGPPTNPAATPAPSPVPAR
jgi:hypothetical protein